MYAEHDVGLLHGAQSMLGMETRIDARCEFVLIAMPVCRGTKEDECISEHAVCCLAAHCSDRYTAQYGVPSVERCHTVDSLGALSRAQLAHTGCTRTLKDSLHAW